MQMLIPFYRRICVNLPLLFKKVLPNQLYRKMDSSFPVCSKATIFTRTAFFNYRSTLVKYSHKSYYNKGGKIEAEP